MPHDQVVFFNSCVDCVNKKLLRTLAIGNRCFVKSGPMMEMKGKLSKFSVSGRGKKCEYHLHIIDL